MKRFNKILSVFIVCALLLGFSVYFPFSKPEIAHAALKVAGNAELSQEIAEEGMVLLRNTGVLPLNANDDVTAMGAACDSTIYGGGGSGWVNATGLISFRTGLNNANTNRKIKSFRYVTDAASARGKVLYFISRETTEGSDRTPASFEISAMERVEINALIDKVGAENVAVILNVGSVMDTEWLIERNVGAIVVAYFDGERAGYALANLLTGEKNFSGKTVDTWAKRYEYYPGNSIGTFGESSITQYTEDVYVGYRYFETFDPEYEKVNYCFGFGLSYTKFEISEAEFSVDKEGNARVTANVRNVGNYAGKEVVQVYYSAPQGVFGNPAKELAGFAKTKNLKPGEREKVEIEFPISDMAAYDDMGKICLNSWVLEKGEYKIYLGNSIASAGTKGGIGIYNQKEDRVIETTHSLPDTLLNKRLTANGTFELLRDENISNTTHVIAAAGATTVQAEVYSDISSAATAENYYIGTTSGRGVGNLNVAGRYIEYDLYVERAGDYKAAFSMASAWNGQNNMFNLTVNGVKQNVSVSMNATHTESDSMWYRGVYLKNPDFVVTLPQGNVKMKLTGNGTAFMNIDLIELYNNVISSDKRTVIEAENADASSLGTVQYANGFATAQSSGANNYFTYKMHVEKAGKYDFSLTASNVTKASENAVSLFINGDNKGDFALKRTAAGGSGMLESNKFAFTDTDSLIVDLPQGDVELKFVTNDSALACLDKITVNPAGDKPLINGNYEENTQRYEIADLPLEGKTLPSVITYNDVMLDRSKMDDFVSQLSVNELVYLMGCDQANAVGDINTGGVGGYKISSKYGIPNAYTADGPAGIRMGGSNYATWFPCMTLLASTYNTELAERFGYAVGQEALNGNVNVWLAPGLNIHRDPLCGRNFEYFSEDPLISGKFTAAVTRGAQSTGVSVCIKHFAANSQETNRFNNDSYVSNRALREIYLKGFEIAVKESDPYSLMSSYNLINGTYAAATKELITDVLRGDWGFDGGVFSDWTAANDHISLVLAGNDFKSFNARYDTLVAAYKSGVLTREDLETVAKSALNFLMRSNAAKQITNTLFESKNTALSMSNATVKGVTDNGYSAVYRLYATSESWYTVKSSGSATVTLDGTEIKADGKEVVMFTCGVHELRLDGTAAVVQSSGNITLVATENPDVHKHNFVNGVCSCGETDPDYHLPHEHVFVNGICNCGEVDTSYVEPHEHVFVEGICSCGQIDADYKPHLHHYFDGVCECGASDPLYVHSHEFVEGECRCGETDPDYVAPEPPKKDTENGNCKKTANVNDLAGFMFMIVAAAIILRIKKK